MIEASLKNMTYTIIQSSSNPIISELARKIVSKRKNVFRAIWRWVRNHPSPSLPLIDATIIGSLARSLGYIPRVVLWREENETCWKHAFIIVYSTKHKRWICVDSTNQFDKHPKHGRFKIVELGGQTEKLPKRGK